MWAFSRPKALRSGLEVSLSEVEGLLMLGRISGVRAFRSDP